MIAQNTSAHSNNDLHRNCLQLIVKNGLNKGSDLQNEYFNVQVIEAKVIESQ